MGHEFSGVVVEVGNDVEHLSAGQRVVVRPTIFDKTCSSCIKGIQHCCDNIGFIGLSGKCLISVFFVTEAIAHSVDERLRWWFGRVYRRPC